MIDKLQIKNNLLKIKQSYNSKGYVRNVFVLMSGTLISQLIGFLFYPIIARIFTPVDFGQLATINAIVGVLGVIVSGKYEGSILIAKNKRVALNIFILSLFLSVSILLILYITSFILFDRLHFIFNDAIPKKLLYIPFLTTFFIKVYQCYNEWCVRNKYFINLSYNKIANSVFISGTQFLFGITNFFASSGLIIGDIVGRGFSALSCIVGFLKRDRSLIKSISLKRMQVYAIRYKDFPTYIMPDQLLNVVGGSFAIFAIGYLFDSTEVGLYSMANLVIAIPSSLISRAMADVFRQRASIEYQKIGNCRAVYLKNVFAISAISIVGYSILFLIAPSLFSFVLGSEWEQAGVFARILIPITAISMVSNPVYSMFIIAEKLRVGFYWQILYFAMSTFPFILGFWIKDIFTVLVIFSCCMTFAHIVCFILSYKYTINKNYK